MAKIARPVNYDSAPIAIPTFTSALGLSISSGQRIKVVATGEIYAVLRNAAGTELLSAIVEKDLMSSASALGGATDSAAVHVDVAGEIDGITEKTTLADDDLFIIEDSAAAGIKKKVKKSNVGGATMPEDTNTPVSSNTNITTATQTIVSDTSGGALNHTLPVTPTTYQIVVFVGDATSETNNITIDGNGNTINGAANYTITEEYGTKALWYNGTDWLILYGYENIWYIEDGRAKTRNGIEINANMLSGFSGIEYTATGDDVTGDVDTASPNDTISASVSYDTDHWINDGTQGETAYDGASFIRCQDAAIKISTSFSFFFYVKIPATQTNSPAIITGNAITTAGANLAITGNTALNFNNGSLNMTVTATLPTTVWTKIVAVWDYAGNAQMWMDDVSQGTDGAFTTPTGTTTDLTIGTEPPASTTREFKGDIKNWGFCSGVITNPTTFSMTSPTDITGATILSYSSNGSGQDDTEGRTWAETGTIAPTGGFVSTNNFIPYEILPSPTAQVQAATLIVYDDTGAKILDSFYNVMWSVDGGTDGYPAGALSPSAFRALGLLTTSTDYRIAIQPVGGQKIGSIFIAENTTEMRVTDTGGVELIINGVKIFELSEAGHFEMKEAVAPTLAPISGGTLYFEGGVLKYMLPDGSSKTVTVT